MDWIEHDQLHCVYYWDEIEDWSVCRDKSTVFMCELICRLRDIKVVNIICQCFYFSFQQVSVVTTDWISVCNRLSVYVCINLNAPCFWPLKKRLRMLGNQENQIQGIGMGFDLWPTELQCSRMRSASWGLLKDQPRSRLPLNTSVSHSITRITP